MIVFPNAKINLGLNIVSRRNDGYHELETVFYPVRWTDVLEINKSDKLDFTAFGMPIPGVAAQNLCVKAFKLINNVFNIDFVDIKLLKNIPIGAGLGGGSSDGAFMLKALNELFHLNMSNSQLKMMAKELGADCPFFIENVPIYAGGIGDEFEEINLDLSAYKIVLIFPDIHVETSWAYSLVTPEVTTPSVLEIINDYPLDTWMHYLKNDFEKEVFEKHESLKEIKDNLIANNAKYASMSGSGSSIYGIFEKDTDFKALEQFMTLHHYYYRILDL